MFKCPVCWEKGDMWYFKLREDLEEDKVYCPNCESELSEDSLLEVNDDG